MLRDQEIVALNVNNEQVLRQMLEGYAKQFRVGALTRTDVAQSEQRLAAASALRRQAEGTLQTSRAEYVRAIGHPPEKLEAPANRPILPATRDQALEMAATQNATVIAAIFTEDAARDAVAATQAQLLPKLNVVGDFTKALDTNYRGYRSTSETVTAQLAIPLYEGGAVYSQTRQAVATVRQRQGQTDDARRAALQGATQAWEAIDAARDSRESWRLSIRAGEVALDSTRREQKVGSRTVLDVLNAEQESS